MEETRAQLRTLQASSATAIDPAQQNSEVDAGQGRALVRDAELLQEVEDARNGERSAKGELDVVKGRLAQAEQTLQERDAEVQELRGELRKAQQQLVESGGGGSAITAAALKRLQDLLDEERQAHASTQVVFGTSAVLSHPPAASSVEGIAAPQRGHWNIELARKWWVAQM